MLANTQSTWTVDTGHSEVHFKIKHLGITNVNGTFDLFQGTVHSGQEDFSDAAVHFEIDTNSINTNNAARDKHLRSPDLFDTEKFPKIIFDGVLKKLNDNYELAGKLIICETARDIILTAVFTGSGKGRFNDLRAGFEVDGKINRKDYGLDWNILTDAGSFVVGEEVKLHFDIQLIKQ